MSTPRTADGVVLRTVDYSETSQVVTFWTREAGRMTGIAKGAKRARTAFHGPFDLFALHRLNYREKTAGQLHLLTAADLLDAHAGLRADPVRLIAAGWCAEILLGLTAEGMPTPDLFDLLAETLAGLSGAGSAGSPASPPPWEAVLFRFEAQALTHLGHRPRLAACAACGAPHGPTALYSPRAGGALCDRCARGEAASLRVRAESLRLLDRLAEPGPLLPAPPPPAPFRQEVRAVLRAAYTDLLERPPVALTMLP